MILWALYVEVIGSNKEEARFLIDSSLCLRACLAGCYEN